MWGVISQRQQLAIGHILINDENLPAFDFLEISNEITESVINRSSERKATGYDGIPISLIKENKTTLSPILTHIINLIMRTSKFPDSQKIARVTPLHKKGSKSDPNNYRPIYNFNSIIQTCRKDFSITAAFPL